MSSQRFAGIPADHLAAEVAAFPLVSEAALSLKLTALSPSMKAPTRDLWRATENHLIRNFPSYSLEEAIAVRDQIWFGAGAGGEVSLPSYLRYLSRSHLEDRGTIAVPRLAASFTAHPAPSAPEARARWAWRWLSFALPPDLMLAAAGSAGRCPSRIEMLTPALAQQLSDRGYAEVHLHLGAALDFPLWWVGVLHALADPSCGAAAFASPGADLEEGRLLGPWLLRAAVARYALAAFLARASAAGSFLDFLHGTVRRRVVDRGGPTAFSLLLIAFCDLENGEISEPDRHAALQRLYRELAGLPGSLSQAGPEAVLESDPIATLLPRRAAPSSEVRFVCEALSYLESAAGRDDLHFSLLFWQIIRARSLCYRHVVQRPLTPGLQWFVRFYGRQRVGSRAIDRVLLDAAAKSGGAGRGLRSLEIRTTADPSYSSLQSFVHTLDQAAESWRREDLGLELGVVFHFAKDRDVGGTRRGYPGVRWSGSHADPSADVNPTGYRYAHYYCGQRNRAMALEWLLRHRPLALRVVRGLDVCSDEIGVPNWVLAPLFKRLRWAAEEASIAARGALGRDLPALRTTAHAGEDFVHLLTGLRYVDDAIEGLELGEGDRIGHGLSLGVDPGDWAARAGQVAVAREERLFDLIWEWRWSARQGRDPGSDRRHQMDLEIAELSEAIFLEPLSPFVLAGLRDDLHDPDWLHAAGFPAGPRPRTRPGKRISDRFTLLRSYLCDPEVFRRGRETVYIDPSTEVDVLSRLQAELRAKLGERCLAVEVNPTSNLLIGDLGNLETHPIWRLRPPRAGGDAPPVAICIGSDDPVVFGSDLRQEYQWLKDAMGLAGLSDEEAQQWLERTRATGLAQRFTLARPPDEPDLLELWSSGRSQPRIPI